MLFQCQVLHLCRISHSLARSQNGLQKPMQFPKKGHFWCWKLKHISVIDENRFLHLMLGELSTALQSFLWCELVEDCWWDIFNFFGRAHANGSIRRGHKNEATDAVTMRTGLGINLKEVKVFNRAREKGWLFLRMLLIVLISPANFMYISAYQKLSNHWFYLHLLLLKYFF